MANLTYRDGVSIGLIVVYVPLLIIAIMLIFRHGFSRKSGWLFLVVFALARIIGGAFELATINDRYNTTDLTGYAILQNIGLSPLLLVSLGLLSRNVTSINKTHRTLISPFHLRLVQLVLLAGLILGTIGGIDAIDGYTTTGKYTPATKSKIGVALFIVSYVMIVVATIVVSFSISHAEPGEKRILFAVAAALPFLLVRLVYSAIAVFANLASFSSLTGDVTILLVMGYIMELVAVLLYEVVGLSVPKAQPIAEGHPVASPEGTHNGNKAYDAPQDNLAVRIAKRSIFGRIFMAMSGGNRENDIEMQGRQGRERRHRRQRRR